MNHQVDPHMQFGHRGLSMEIKIAKKKTPKNNQQLILKRKLDN